MIAARISQGWLLSELWKACAVPWKAAMTVSGLPTAGSAVRIAVTASPRA